MRQPSPPVACTAHHIPGVGDVPPAAGTETVAHTDMDVIGITDFSSCRPDRY
jgi:hypothetical protein